jgi:two-component system, sensor histidine kinase LadS
MAVGSAIEALIFSYALADKLNLLKKEHEENRALILKQSTKYSEQLILLQEEERKKIAAELHNSVGQNLSVIKNSISMLKKKTDFASNLQDINDTVSGTIEEVRNISYGLRPFHFDLVGLSQSIRSLIEEVACSSEIRFYKNIEDIDGQLSKEAEINLYRVVQESLNNIIKHSKATETQVNIKNVSASIHIEIQDNGAGFGKQQINMGLGLIGIKERINIIGGSINIKTEALKGTNILISIPVK